MKICTECKVEKPVSAFSKQTAAKDNLQRWCKTCNRLHQQTPEGKAAHQKSHKKYYQSEAGKATHRRSSEVQRSAHPDRIKARQTLYHAINSGRIKRPSTCEECSKKRFVHGHHEDYNKPLDVDWLCIKCHNKLHEELRRL